MELIQTIEQWAWIGWLVLILVFLVIEMLTLDFTFLMLSIGGLAGLVADVAGAPIWLQVIIAAAVVVYWPSSPQRLLVSSPFVALREGRLVYECVGRTSAVTVVETEGHYYFRCNGLPEGGVAPRGAPPFGRLAERWLTILPALARPDARSMMVIGLGAGAALEAVPPQFETMKMNITTWMGRSRPAFIRMKGRMRSIDAPVVPTMLARTAPAARSVVFAHGVALVCTWIRMPPETT